MSLVLAQQWHDKALIVTDTLASTLEGDSYRPRGFSTKIHTLPHMNMVFAFRGVSRLAALWEHELTEVSKCQDIEDAHEVAASRLKQRVESAARRHDLPPEKSGASFYCFGFPHGAAQLVSYAYENANEYAGERFEVSSPSDPEYEEVRFLAAPSLQTSIAPDVLLERADYIDYATRVKDEHDRDLVDEVIPIGGDLFATFVENWKIRTVLWHRFPDYDTTWEQIRPQDW